MPQSSDPPGNFFDLVVDPLPERDVCLRSFFFSFGDPSIVRESFSPRKSARLSVVGSIRNISHGSISAVYPKHTIAAVVNPDCLHLRTADLLSGQSSAQKLIGSTTYGVSSALHNSPPRGPSGTTMLFAAYCAGVIASPGSSISASVVATIDCALGSGNCIVIRLQPRRHRRRPARRRPAW